MSDDPAKVTVASVEILPRDKGQCRVMLSNGTELVGVINARASAGVRENGVVFLRVYVE